MGKLGYTFIQPTNLSLSGSTKTVTGLLWRESSQCLYLVHARMHAHTHTCSHKHTEQWDNMGATLRASLEASGGLVIQLNSAFELVLGVTGILGFIITEEINKVDPLRKRKGALKCLRTNAMPMQRTPCAEFFKKLDLWFNAILKNHIGFFKNGRKTFLSGRIAT